MQCQVCSVLRICHNCGKDMDRNNFENVLSHLLYTEI